MESPVTEPAVDQAVTETAVAEPGADLTSRVAELERDLELAQRTLRQAESRAQILRALAGAAPVDADAVAVVVEAALAKAEGAIDAGAIASAVEDARRTHPALFRATAPSRTAPMAARVERPATRLEDAATHAAQRGDRASLMHYLRLRRGG